MTDPVRPPASSSASPLPVSSAERLAFSAYTRTVFDEVQKRPDAEDIEIEMVFPKWAPHIVLRVLVDNSSRDVVVDLGTPSVTDVDEERKHVVARPRSGTLPDEFKEWGTVGFDVYVHATTPRHPFLPYLRDVDKPVTRHAPRVFTAVRNTIGGRHDVYHLFPCLSVNADGPASIGRLCTLYADLAHRSEARVPNYLLSAVRRRGHNPHEAPPDAFHEVVDTLVQKSRDLERELERDRLLMHTFGAREFKRVYKRFKALADEDGGDAEEDDCDDAEILPHVAYLGSSMTVDIAVDMGQVDASSNDAAHTPHKKTTTRLTLHGQSAFNAFCTQYKTLRSPEELADYVASCPQSACELMQKSEMTADELPTMSTARYPTSRRYYNGYKLNVKREHPMDKTKSLHNLRAFLRTTVVHTYRFKQRHTFSCGGFRVDLTVVRRADDSHTTFRPTPYIALQKLKQQGAHTETYELEIEQDRGAIYTRTPRATSSPATCSSVEEPATSASTLLRLMDECLHALHGHVEYFGQRRRLAQYPRLLDASEVARVCQQYNQQPCHPRRVHDFHSAALRVKTNASPNVANMTHVTHSYVCHHWEDYRLLIKTDGLHCVGLISPADRMLYLYTNKAISWMAFPLATCPDVPYVLDGEFYFHGASECGHCTFFIFDVYAKGTAHTLGRTLDERLDAFDDASVKVAGGYLHVRKKTPLPLDFYQAYAAAATTPASTLSEDARRRFAAFECRDANGTKPEDDGFIVMHGGALVRADVASEEDEIALVQREGVKTYIMREEVFRRKGRGLADESQQMDPYVLCLKWKPEEECTIDFQVRFRESDADAVQEAATTRTAWLCSKYNNPRTIVNLYTVLRAMALDEEDPRAPMVPRKRFVRTTPNGNAVAVHAFQPAQAYDYELGSDAVVHGVPLPCDPQTGAVKTVSGERVTQNAIVEMRYHSSTRLWTPARLRTDKQEPNAYNVALANWQNIFDPIPPPERWEPAPREAYDASALRAYYSERGGGGRSNIVDRIHHLLKQYLIFRVAQVYADDDPRRELTVYEMGCGRGTDLFHWHYVHEHIRTIRFYLGTDYDAQWLVCAEGAVERYLQGPGSTSGAYALDTKYPFPAVYAQADSSASLKACEREPWSADKRRPKARAVSKYKLHYQLLRHVWFGTAPEEPALVEAFAPALVQPTYGLISSQMAMHHFASPRGGFWDNLYRLLASDGYYIATVPNGDFIRDKLSASPDGTYRVRVRVEHTQRRKPRGGGRRSRSQDGAPQVMVQEQDWYMYERASPSGGPPADSEASPAPITHVRFQTPKINPSVEPLFFRDELVRAAGKRFDVLYMDTFGAFAQAHGMNIYDVACDPFALASIDRERLQHDPSRAKASQRVVDTPAALEYSQQGHYVVVLGKAGRHAGELDRVRRVLQGTLQSAPA